LKEEVELWPCQYAARCRAATLPHTRDRSRCSIRGTLIVRYVDAHGRPLRQAEVCERHAHEMTSSGIAVRDMMMISVKEKVANDFPVTRRLLERLDEWLMPLAEPLLPLGQVPAGSGAFFWAFREQSDRAMLVGKAVRMISGVRAAMALAESGFIAECGTILRTVLDFAYEIIAICEGCASSNPTNAQRRFIEQYFAPMAATPEQYEQQKRERWVTRRELLGAHARWATEFGGDAKGVQSLISFVAYAYDKFVHGAYITAMELYDGDHNRFMLKGHDASEKRCLYKEATARALHTALTALCVMAQVSGMWPLAQDIGRSALELHSSGEISVPDEPIP
jgi:hypothetical protein